VYDGSTFQLINQIVLPVRWKKIYWVFDDITEDMHLFLLAKSSKTLHYAKVSKDSIEQGLFDMISLEGREINNSLKFFDSVNNIWIVSPNVFMSKKDFHSVIWFLDQKSRQNLALQSLADVRLQDFPDAFTDCMIFQGAILDRENKRYYDFNIGANFQCSSQDTYSDGIDEFQA